MLMTKMKLKQRVKIGIVLNFIIFIVTVIAIAWQIIFRGNGGPLGDFGSGFGSLQTFTNESNILCAVIALILAIIGIRNLGKRKYYFSHAQKTLQLVGTTVVLLTFTIVAVFLAPLYGIQTGQPMFLFASSMFFTHFLTPLLAVVTFVFFTPTKAKLTICDSLIALVPILIYGVVYLINVVFLAIWPDFYHFTFGGQNQLIPLVFIVILAGSFGLARLLIYFQQKHDKIKA